jgi:DNA-directed RNA polymerase subunit RPC12/RpoP
MRYKCSKSCGYTFKGRTEDMPTKCPGCDSELVRYLLARKKGIAFEEKDSLKNLEQELKEEENERGK